MQAFVWGVVGDILESLEGVPDFSLAAMALPTGGKIGSDNGESECESVSIVGPPLEPPTDESLTA